MAERYYWKGMASDIANYCSTCLVCQRQNKMPKKTSELHPVGVPNHAFAQWGMHLVGPLSGAFVCFFTVLTEYGTVSAKISHLLILCWGTNALRLNRYNFRTVTAMNIVFSALHTRPVFYGKLFFRVLHMHSADDTRPDTPWGSKPPYLRVGEFKSLHLWCVRREVLSLLICYVQ